MAKFTVRVELHDGRERDYTQLHEAMRDEGFSHAIRDSDGTEYYLPTAEYNFDGDAGRNQVLNAAKRAADTTGRGFEVIVTESAGRTWHQLTPVHSR